MCSSDVFNDSIDQFDAARLLKFALELGKNRYFKGRHHKGAKGGRVPGLNYDGDSACS